MKGQRWPLILAQPGRNMMLCGETASNYHSGEEPVRFDSALADVPGLKGSCSRVHLLICLLGGICRLSAFWEKQVNGVLKMRVGGKSLLLHAGALHTVLHMYNQIEPLRPCACVYTCIEKYQSEMWTHLIEWMVFILKE